MNTEFLGRVIERWGFPVLVAIGCGAVLRNDVLVPLVEEHRLFVRQLSESQKEMTQTQRDIGRALDEQSRIMNQLIIDKTLGDK